MKMCQLMDLVMIEVFVKVKVIYLLPKEELITFGNCRVDSFE